jgi:hypothetical protein
MKTIAYINRMVLTGLLAVTIGLAAAPQSRATVVDGQPSRTVSPLAGKEGNETHGRGKDGNETHGRGKDGNETHGRGMDGCETHE